jgi:hypothetical protein
MTSNVRSAMPNRLAEPNRILGPRRSIRASVTAWVLAAVLHVLVLILILFLLSPPSEPTPTTTILLPFDPGGGFVPPGSVPAATRSTGRVTQQGGATRASRLTRAPDSRDEEEGVLMVEVPSGGGSTALSGTAGASGAGMTALRASTMPLVATGYGIGRRTVTRDENRIARMRAESLVNAMIASVVDVKPPLKAGPFGFPAGGGVSIPIPWGGFVRDDRDDDRWREERCRGRDDGKADKPGEAEARRSRCS